MDLFGYPFNDLVKRDFTFPDDKVSRRRHAEAKVRHWFNRLSATLHYTLTFTALSPAAQATVVPDLDRVSSLNHDVVWVPVDAATALGASAGGTPLVCQLVTHTMKRALMAAHV